MSLLKEIKDNCPALVRASRDAQRIAEAVSINRKRPSGLEVGHGTVLEVLGLAAGNRFLDAIYNAPDFRHVRPLLEQGHLVISSPMVVASINSMVPLVLTRAEADKLLAIASVPDPVSEFDVRRACWSDAGEWLA